MKIILKLLIVVFYFFSDSIIAQDAIYRRYLNEVEFTLNPIDSLFLSFFNENDKCISTEAYVYAFFRRNFRKDTNMIDIMTQEPYQIDYRYLYGYANICGNIVFVDSSFSNSDILKKTSREGNFGFSQKVYYSQYYLNPDNDTVLWLKPEPYFVSWDILYFVRDEKVSWELLPRINCEYENRKSEIDSILNNGWREP